MSLRVWLPLNGDINNQGLSNITVTNNGATVDNNGKIGKCYSFGTASSYLVLPSDDIKNCTTECSFSFWLNIISWNTSYATYFQAGLGSTPWAHYIFGVLRNNQNSNLCFTISNGSSASNASYTTSNLELNNWYHLAFVYKTGHCLIYINGSLYKDYTTTIVPAFSTITKTTIGTCNNITNYQTNCKLNDIRIYDHALSAKEVKEISKGLVLHYKLDNGSFGGQDNIYDFQSVASKWLVEEGTTRENYTDSVYGNVVKVISSSGNKRIYRNVSNVWTQGQKYTVSFLAKADSSCVCDMSRSLINFTQQFTLTTEWKRYSGVIDCTATVTGGTLSFRVITTGVNAYITQIKLEYGEVATAYRPNINDPDYNKLGYNSTTVYDCSGYNYHGTPNGDLTVSSDTARNSLSTVFSNSQYIALGNQLYNIKDEMTVNLWCYKENWNTNAGTPFSSVQSGGYGWQVSSTNFVFYCGTGASSNTYISSAVTTSSLSSGWHMLSATYDGLALRVYIDGELKNTVTKYTTKTPIFYNNNSGMFISGESAGSLTAPSGDLYTGKISDVRIYATALSTDDVKELYQLGASIDKSGNVFAYEYKED